MREPRQLTNEEVKEILSLTKDDLNKDKMEYLFAVTKQMTEERFNPSDSFKLPRGRCFNDRDIETTVGRYLVNAIAFPPKLTQILGYLNEPLTKGKIEDIEIKIASYLIEDMLTVGEVWEYLDNVEWLTMNMAFYINSTLNFDINVPFEAVMKRRDELFEKYRKEIAEGDNDTIGKIEKELLALAKQEAEKSKNPAFDMYNSGVGAFGNNYKKISIMCGAIENPLTKKLEVIKSNYDEGVTKEEFKYMPISNVLGVYARAVETGKYGYSSKQLNAGLQTVSIDPAGSDCHTPYYLDIVIPEKMKETFLQRYIIENGKLVLLTGDNINKYSGKRVKLRSPMMCKSKTGICSKCIGEYYYKVGMKYPGLTASTLTGSLLNKSLKKIHDATVVFSHIDIDDFISDVE